MKKLVLITVVLSLICIGIVGIIILINNRLEEAAHAIEIQDTNNNNDDNEDQDIVEDNDDDENQDEESEDNNDNQDINEEELHNDSNIDEIKEFVGEEVYNFDAGQILQVENQDSLHVLVNKKNELDSNYEPNDLVVPEVKFSFDGNDQKKQMRSVAANALEELINGALENDYRLVAVSGYRSYNRQQTIYQGNVDRMGEEAANKVSAKPGQSEHQTGLAMDVSCESIGYSLEESLGDLPEGKWLAKNAHAYGFIIRYPKDKTDITQYNYEPWHVRYVGKALATYLYENDLTLDEFYEQINNEF
ncbi:MAG: peptidase M15 [Firmicutes bacterium HGW-Firmicutes-1]|jgi:LAS superfamily LD-carboxypeptidase LdcB|nr:MAG: peptidase M15 [Firmicutes bacterium HGW-Firmicutes-1]